MTITTVRTVAACVALLLVITSPARADEKGQGTPVISRQAIGRAIGVTAPPRQFGVAPQHANAAHASRRVAATTAGVVGGLIAGVWIGAKIGEAHCSCGGDGAMMGSFVGAPIGAIAGGVAGYVLWR